MLFSIFFSVFFPVFFAVFFCLSRWSANSVPLAALTCKCLSAFLSLASEPRAHNDHRRGQPITWLIFSFTHHSFDSSPCKLFSVWPLKKVCQCSHLLRRLLKMVARRGLFECAREWDFYDRVARRRDLAQVSCLGVARVDMRPDTNRLIWLTQASVARHYSI